MKTYLECIPCFLNQALRAMNLTNQDSKTKSRVIKKIMITLAKIKLDKKPPEYAQIVYKIIEKETKNNDSYKKIKIRDNKCALALLKDLRIMIKKSKDPLLTATKIAIAGNIMDFAAHPEYDVKKTIREVIKNNFSINDYNSFNRDIRNAKSIVYIADNSGEIVLDRLLIEQIRKLNKNKIFFFIKGKPILNDATIEDTKDAGIDKINNLEIRKISTGFPNTGVERTSREFIKFLKSQSIIISKGQGNYESLSEINANIYFLLIAKCPVIAKDLRIKPMQIVCKKSDNRLK